LARLIYEKKEGERKKRKSIKARERFRAAVAHRFFRGGGEEGRGVLWREKEKKKGEFLESIVPKERKQKGERKADGENPNRLLFSL